MSAQAATTAAAMAGRSRPPKAANADSMFMSSAFSAQIAANSSLMGLAESKCPAPRGLSARGVSNGYFGGNGATGEPGPIF